MGRLALARDVAVVPQEEQLAFSVSVEELVLMGRFPRSEGRLFEGPADLARAREAMALAGVLELGDHPVDTLAGGERQRALLARALAQEPRVLLLDEPTSHLDLLHQRHLVGLLRRLNRERGMTVIFVSHDLNLAGELADRLLLLSGGRVVRLGPPARGAGRGGPRGGVRLSGVGGAPRLRPPRRPRGQTCDFQTSISTLGARGESCSDVKA